MNVKKGDKYSYLTVDRVEKRICYAKCDCGNLWSGDKYSLMKGAVKSCGCLRVRIQKDSHYIDGRRASPLYQVWFSMKRRCANVQEKRYGGRGISVCDEWLDFWDFHNWSIDNGYKKGLQIDRIDNNGNYCPNNCRFADCKTNQRNKSTNSIFEIDGVTKCVADWADHPDCKVCAIRITMRIRRGWDPKSAVFTPNRKYVKPLHG